MSPEELASRLLTAVESPAGLAVFSLDVVSEEELADLLAKWGLSEALRLRRLSSSSTRSALLVVYVNEEACEKRCVGRCAHRETRCFGECLYDCVTELRRSVAEALRRAVNR
ncbi:MAG: hypothetical protein QXU97_03250 [Fervidicoccaceae archaeon]